VPVDIVNGIVPQIIKHGKIIRPGIGAILADNRIAKRLGIEGVLVLGVEPNGAAARAGLQPTTQYRGEITLGDIITAVDGLEVRSVEDLLSELERHQVGAEVPFTIMRNGRTTQLTIRLEAAN